MKRSTEASPDAEIIRKTPAESSDSRKPPPDQPFFDESLKAGLTGLRRVMERRRKST